MTKNYGGIDYEALKQIQEQENSSNSYENNSNVKIIYGSQLDTNVNEVAILPPLPHANGIWFQKIAVLTIDGKKYVTKETLDKDDKPCREIYYNAKTKAEKDNDTKMLKLLNDFRKISVGHEWLFPALVFNFPDEVFDKEGNMIDGDGNPLEGDALKPYIVNEEGVIVSVNQTLFGQINSIITNRKKMGKIIHPEGYNLVMGRPQPKKYECNIGEEINKPLEYYDDDSKIPDVWEHARLRIRSNKFVVDTLEAYLYGGQAPEKDLWLDKEDGKTDEQPEKKAVAKEVVKEDVKEETPVPQRRRAVIEEEAPAKTGAIVIEHEEEDAPEEKPLPPKMKIVVDKEDEEPLSEVDKTPAPKKRGRRNILDDMD